jgi:hypothetical protein
VQLSRKQSADHRLAEKAVRKSRIAFRLSTSSTLPFIGYPRTLNGLRMIDEVTLA